MAGCGGVIWRREGQWIGGFAESLGTWSAYLAKLWGVFKGSGYAQKQCY
jgi:hypothetical protein